MKFEMSDNECTHSPSRNRRYEDLENTVFKESRGKDGPERLYRCTQARVEKINRLSTGSSLRYYFINFFQLIFLPVGFPHSVSDDYVAYQLWDTLQAFCSTITGSFATKSVLQVVGVGDESATALSAAITWIIKDGSGMIGRIMFAWWKGTSLDADCKYWRIFADILNDIALSIQFLLPFLHLESTLYILCITSTMTAIVVVAGGATRAAITQHQTLRGNMADVSAKDGSQETCVNLVGSICSIGLLSALGETQWLASFVFFSLTFLHIYANYRAICALVFNTLNINRFQIVFNSFLMHDAVPRPKLVNKQEPIFRLAENSTVRSSFNIVMGESLQCVFKQFSVHELKSVMCAFDGKPFIIVPDFKRNTLFVAFLETVHSEVVIKAYFHASMLGIALSIYNHLLIVDAKQQLHHATPIQRLLKLMKSFGKAVQHRHLELFPIDKFLQLNALISTEAQSFRTALCVNNWTLDHHSLPLGEWTINWNGNIQ